MISRCVCCCFSHHSILQSHTQATTTLILEQNLSSLANILFLIIIICWRGCGSAVLFSKFVHRAFHYFRLKEKQRSGIQSARNALEALRSCLLEDLHEGSRLNACPLRMCSFGCEYSGHSITHLFSCCAVTIQCQVRNLELAVIMSWKACPWYGVFSVSRVHEHEKTFQHRSKS